MLPLETEGCDDFWTNPQIIQLYKNSVQAILGRKNTITGIPYGQDPTFFSWNLINEGRCETENCTAADVQVGQSACTLACPSGKYQ